MLNESAVRVIRSADCRLSVRYVRSHVMRSHGPAHRRHHGIIVQTVAVPVAAGGGDDSREREHKRGSQRARRRTKHTAQRRRAGPCAVVHAAALFSYALADVLRSDFRYVLRCVRCSLDRRRKFDRHLSSSSSLRPVAVSQFHPLKVSSESYPAPPSFPTSTISASSSPSVFLTSSAGDFVSVRTA